MTTAWAAQLRRFSFDGVVKRYGALEALSGVSFKVNRGRGRLPDWTQWFWQVDVAALCQCARDDRRRSRYLRRRRLQHPQSDVRKLRRRMGMVFQNFELFPHLTVLRNVSIGPTTVLGMTQEAAQQRAAESCRRWVYPTRFTVIRPRSQVVNSNALRLPGPSRCSLMSCSSTSRLGAGPGNDRRGAERDEEPR